jgi:predicted permease
MAHNAPVILLESVWRDAQYAFRVLWRRRSLAWAGVLTLALGIAAVTVVFSVFQAVVLRAIPGSAGDRLAVIGYTSPSEGPSSAALSHAALDELAARRDVFDAVGSWQRTTGVVWSNEGQSVDLLAFGVSARFFDLFGVPAALGRTFAPDEDQSGKTQVAVLADRFWRAQFGADRQIVGRVLTINGAPYVVIGVMPPDFILPNGNVQVWVPDTATADELARTAGDHFPIGRIRSGLTWPAAADLLARQQPQRAIDLGLDLRYAIRPLQDQLVGPVGTVLPIMLAVVGLVLGIACANVAILLLVHRGTRQREIGVQLALGAGRARIVRQACAEGLLLSLAAVVSGVMLAALGIRLVTSMGPTTIPRLGTVALTWEVLAVATATAIAAGLIAGILASARVARGNLDGTLGDGVFVTRTGLSLASRHRGQALLAFGQLALVTVLVVGSGLLLRSLTRLLTIDLGMDTSRVLGFQVASRPQPPSEQTRPPQVDAEQLVSDLRGLPNVEAAAVLTLLPTGRGGFFRNGLQAERAPGDWVTLPPARYQYVTDAFFTTLRMRIISGRPFSAGDVWGAPGVAIVSEAFAATAWPGQNPIGKRLEPSRPTTVVGVVKDIRYDLGSASELQVYYAWRQWRHPAMAVVVRYGPDLASPLQHVEAYLKGALPADRVVSSAAPLEGIARRSTVEPRFYAVSLGAFALSALVLAAIGVYGVSAHLVAQRTREFGIRLALGARPRDVSMIVARSSAWLAASGVAAGLAGAAAVTNVLQGLLFEITPLDTGSFIAAPLIVALAVLVAGWAPARRAARIDPVRLLRAE